MSNQIIEDYKKYQSAIESMLFVWGEPLSISKIAKQLDLKITITRKLLDDLMLKYESEERGIQILETNGHYQFCTLKENYSYIESLCQTSKSKGLSNSALEVLAIIAYKQPITKLDIEQIRGVSSDGPLQHLIERRLVEVVGKLEKIGRPQIYGTTDIFLKSFGYKTIKELPSINEFDAFNVFQSKAIEMEEMNNDSNQNDETK
ncbi:SMC-Scp complex subunit ScpB [Fusibacter ferrireducens]|uniref:Segregation and condensation protein B n=1 Tax=Fusibacter ferrireducens TaxID=2785058 RepID=A0ABR9ZTJ0_9FIRM|nr:SMC-Scp complex subunit ScpB [Fusibacter ferrireducens]MBF4693666.1 SMC-Scp complex subunit ScpB [Fusibacter ferrireducens]